MCGWKRPTGTKTIVISQYKENNKQGWMDVLLTLSGPAEECLVVLVILRLAPLWPPCVVKRTRLHSLSVKEPEEPCWEVGKERVKHMCGIY